MAIETVGYLEYEVTAPDAADQEVQIKTSATYEQQETFAIEVTSGTIQFCQGQAVGANSPLRASGDKFLLTARKGNSIFYKATASGAKFIIGS